MEICRAIDKLGRLVIPSDIRKAYGIESGISVYFTMQENGILLHLKKQACDNEENKRL